MAKVASKSKTVPKQDLGLKDFAKPEDQGLSLDQLSGAYAQLLDTGDDPYCDSPPVEELSPTIVTVEEFEDHGDSAASVTADDGCAVSPRSILEAMFFVGHPHNEPLTSQQVASLMRGVRPDEIDELVVELNAAYAAEQRPYEIVSSGSGYRLVLRESFASLRDKLHGRVKEARLNQAAVDVLAIVAYSQPLTRGQIEQRRGKPSGAVLNQLIRRELLRLDRPDSNPHSARFFTTERFLDLFGLDSLADLPRSQDLDRS